LFPDCPDITTAHLDVVNTIWSLETTNNRPLSSLTVALPRNRGSALLKIQKAIYDVYMLSKEQDAMTRLQSLLQGPEIGLDGLVSALETIPIVWHPSSCSQETLSALTTLYIRVCLDTSYSEAQVLSMENLAGALDKLLEKKAFDKVPGGALVSLWASLPTRPMNPALSNAVIRASGCIMAALGDPEESTAISIHAWGQIMADAALDDQVCSVTSRKVPVFYSNPHRHLTRASQPPHPSSPSLPSPSQLPRTLSPPSSPSMTCSTTTTTKCVT
jgi:hypothetical protein